MWWLVAYVGAATGLVLAGCVAFARSLFARDGSGSRALAVAWWCAPSLWAAAVAFWCVGLVLLPGLVAFGAGSVVLAIAAAIGALAAALASRRARRSVIGALLVTPLPVAALVLVLLVTGGRFE